jgi:hypothetical protein
MDDREKTFTNFLSCKELISRVNKELFKNPTVKIQHLVASPHDSKYVDYSCRVDRNINWYSHSGKFWQFLKI